MLDLKNNSLPHCNNHTGSAQCNTDKAIGVKDSWRTCCFSQVEQHNSLKTIGFEQSAAFLIITQWDRILPLLRTFDSEVYVCVRLRVCVCVGAERHLGIVPLLVWGLHLRQLQEDALRGAIAPLRRREVWGMHVTTTRPSQRFLGACQRTSFSFRCYVVSHAHLLLSLFCKP